MKEAFSWDHPVLSNEHKVCIGNNGCSQTGFELSPSQAILGFQDRRANHSAKSPLISNFATLTRKHII